jgi:hypothetical protein
MDARVKPAHDGSIQSENALAGRKSIIAGLWPGNDDAARETATE